MTILIPIGFWTQLIKSKILKFMALMETSSICAVLDANVKFWATNSLQ
jgi:hypothetical protein